MIPSKATLALVGLLAVAPFAVALEEPEHMSLDLKEIEVDTILNTFARLMHSRLEKHPSVKGTVTFRFDHLSWQTALNAICESASCEWELQEGRDRVLRVVASEGDEVSDRINLSLRYASAREIFDAIAQIDGSELVLDPTVEGALSFEFERIRLDTALDAVCDNVGCSWSRTGSPSQLEIRSLGTLKERDPTLPSERLKKRISLDLLDADAHEVLLSLSRILEVDADLASDLGRVSLDLESRTVGEILDVICDELFLDWRLARNPEGWSLAVMRQKGDFGAPEYEEREP